MAFRYNPLFVGKIKTIPGHKWHPKEKHWSFPNSDGTSEKILETFKDEEIHIDPVLQGTVPDLRTCHGEPVEPAVIESGLSLTNYPYWFSASFPEERGIETP